MKLTILVSAQSLLAAIKHFAEMMAGSSPGPVYEIELTRKDKSKGFYEVNATTIKSVGKTTGFQVILRDVTERRQFEEEIKKEKDDLERLNKVMTDRELKMNELKKENDELR